MSTQFTITADSIPVYDGWGWADYWTCEDWINWHKALKTKYTLENANLKFVQAYNNPPGLLGGIAVNHANCRSLNMSFIDYAKQNGFHTALFEGIGALARPIATVNYGTSQIFSLTERSTKILSFAVPVLIALAAAGIVYFGFQYAHKITK